MTRAPLLVLGLGNVLLEDDGVGSVGVALLHAQFDAPPGVDVLDGGTLGLSLLPYVESADRLILLDAVRADAPAGTIVRLDGDDVAPAVAARLSPHQIGVVDLLDGARLRACLPHTLVLLGIVPQTMNLGIGLSPAVCRALPALIARVVGEAHALGFAFTPRGQFDDPICDRRVLDVGALALVEMRIKPDVRLQHEVRL